MEDVKTLKDCYIKRMWLLIPIAIGTNAFNSILLSFTKYCKLQLLYPYAYYRQEGDATHKL
jgi:hypothetical protein